MKFELQRSYQCHVGSVEPAISLHLTPEEGFRGLRESTVPEMQRSNLASVVLQLKALGIDNVLRFHFLSVGESGHVTF